MAAVATYVIAGLVVAFYASIVTLAVYPFYLVARNVVRALRRRRAARAGAVVASPALEPWRRVALKGGLALGVVLLVAAILIPLYAGVGSRARVAKAQADLRSLASAAAIYGAHMGAPPATLDALTQTARNARGEVAGPFMAQIPTAPSGFTPYSYRVAPDGRAFTLTTAGDGHTVIVP